MLREGVFRRKDLVLKFAHKHLGHEGGKRRTHRETIGKFIELILELTNIACETGTEKREEFLASLVGDIAALEYTFNVTDSGGERDLGEQACHVE